MTSSAPAASTAAARSCHPFPCIEHVVRARQTGYLWVCLLRILYSVLAVALLILAFTGIMRAGESRVLPYHIWGCICSTMLLGALGLAVSGVTGNVAGGLMACMLYYLGYFMMAEKALRKI